MCTLHIKNNTYIYLYVYTHTHIYIYTFIYEQPIAVMIHNEKMSSLVLKTKPMISENVACKSSQLLVKQL